MKVCEGVDETADVSAPVRAEVVHPGGSEQNSYTGSEGVNIRVVMQHLLPVAGRVMRWCVVVTCNEGNFPG